MSEIKAYRMASFVRSCVPVLLAAGNTVRNPKYDDGGGDHGPGHGIPWCPERYSGQGWAHRQDRNERHCWEEPRVSKVPGPPKHKAIPHDEPGVIREGIKDPPTPVAGVAPKLLRAPRRAAGLQVHGNKMVLRGVSGEDGTVQRHPLHNSPETWFTHLGG